MKVGDIVLLPKHSGIDIKDEETQEVIRIVGATEVLGVIEQ
jgi:co-chaperonin GroES (HSP10)